MATTCKFRTSTCHYCKKQGHISKVCRKRTREDKTASRSTNQLTGSDDDEEDTDEYSWLERQHRRRTQVCLLLARKTTLTQKTNPTSNNTLNLASTMAVSCGEVATSRKGENCRELHEGHPGMSLCDASQRNRKLLSDSTLGMAWVRLNIDYACPLL